MLRITQLKLSVLHEPEDLPKKIASRLRVPRGAIRHFYVERRAVDARKKPELFYVYTIVVSLDREKNYLKRSLPAGVQIYDPVVYHFPYEAPSDSFQRPVIVGCGPAGLFCGLMLAKHGFRPVLLERGEEVSVRKQKTAEFWKTGKLDPESNVQFGEGGAGTFSDGKLYTGVHDASGRGREVLRLFTEAGASEDILYEAHAHIGTDQLEKIVPALRQMIEAFGGNVFFRSKAVNLLLKNGRVCGVRTEDGRTFETGAVVLAIGHSARDTFRMLHAAGIPMEAKPFAVGLRVQHRQDMINEVQYGSKAPEIVGAAPYSLRFRTAEGRSVYSFCMCPGGQVINASSAPGYLAVNGMSMHARNSGYANSAVVAAVSPDDCGGCIPEGTEDLWRGLRFQEELEKKAWIFGEGSIPTQRFEDFVRSQEGKEGRMSPCVCGQIRYANVRELLPARFSDAVLEGMNGFSRSVPGFNDPEVLLYGVETRTSSPVRILRNENLRSAVDGLFPCGEGAGYAGGITSAAMDGLAAAEAVAASVCLKF
ncbi:MAG: FAD-dependent oxidoreductase [Eubacterium sp.]|nr:FAD-dependent oxidoreductase [Eubacterium sp.]